MNATISSVWTTLAILFVCGALFPSLYPSNFYVTMSERACKLLFPLRGLLSRVVCKPKWLKFYTDIRRDGQVNLAAVVWYIEGATGLVVMALNTFFEFFSPLALGFFENTMIVLFVLIALVEMIGLLSGDSKDRMKYHVEDVSADDIHMREQIIAYQIGEEIADCQSKLEPFDLAWHIDVLCTDRLADEANTNMGGTLSALTGVPQTNPVYMSRIVLTLRSNGDTVPLPCKRTIDHDICYMINKRLVMVNDRVTVKKCVDDAKELTRMVLYKKGIKD